MTSDHAISAAIAHLQSGQLAPAEALCKQVLAQYPNHPDALHLLGVVAMTTGQSDLALQLISRAVAISPSIGFYHGNLGLVLDSRNQTRQAVDEYRRAIQLQPDLRETYNNLALALQRLGELEEAQATCRKAIKLSPDYAAAHLNLGNILKEQGLLDEAMACYEQVLPTQPEHQLAHSNVIYTLQWKPGENQSRMRRETSLWNQLNAEPLRQFIPVHDNDSSPLRRLRIGYVSADFREHVVGWNIAALLAEHDRAAVEVFCYSNVIRPDQMTQRLQSASDGWRNICGMPDDQAAALIGADRIDILIDLAGHTGNNRLLIFARKPAPVQMTYLGYISPTGVRAIDYRLSDPYLDPPDSDLSYYTEQTVHLPETYWCYHPADQTDAPAPLPATSAGYVTFGCLSDFAKISPDALDLWATILRTIPDSRLILRSPPGSHLQAVRDRFERQGIAPDRLDFFGRQKWTPYMKTYDRIDIGLDPFPCTAGITTCDSLWMGVPVVTLSGLTAASRSGRSLLSNVGLPDLVAFNAAEYAQLAIALAGDLRRLTALRQSLRQRMLDSPLMNPKRFARGIEAAYRQMWQRWCNQQKP